jgi:hypothetical protein
LEILLFNGILLICELALVLVGRCGLRVRAGGQAAQGEVSKLDQQQGQTTTFLEQQLQDLYLQKFAHNVSASMFTQIS